MIRKISSFLVICFSLSFLSAQNFEFRRNAQTVLQESKPQQQDQSNVKNESETAQGQNEKNEAGESSKLSEESLNSGDENTSGESSSVSEGLNTEASGENKNRKSISEIFDPNFFLTFGPMLMINTDSSSRSAPHPVMYSGGAGWNFLPDSNFDLETRLSFFMNYYLWDGEKARPAEVENRTVTALSFLLDISGGYTWKKGANNFSAGGGLGMLFRYGLKSDGVSDDDYNPLTRKSVSGDSGKINSDLLSIMNILHPELFLGYSRTIFNNWKAGVEFRTYLPLGALSSGDGVNGMLFSLSLRLGLPNK